MDMNQPGSYKSGPTSTIITTLYDLITKIDSAQGNQSMAETGYYSRRQGQKGHTGSVTAKVVRMFESGQIKFMNDQDIKRKYAELMVS